MRSKEKRSSPHFVNFPPSIFNFPPSFFTFPSFILNFCPFFLFPCLIFPGRSAKKLEVSGGTMPPSCYATDNISKCESLMQPSMGTLNSPSSSVVKDSTSSWRRILRYIDFRIDESSPTLFLNLMNLHLITFEAR